MPLFGSGRGADTTTLTPPAKRVYCTNKVQWGGSGAAAVGQEEAMTTEARPSRVVFMGTPDFAVHTLDALVAHTAPGDLWPEGLALAGVVTRVDKTAGRGRHPVFSPVKQHALDAGLSVYQPGALRKSEALEQLHALAPDVIVVAAFGQ